MLIFRIEIAGLGKGCSIHRRSSSKHEEGQALDILARTSSELKTAFAEAGDGDVIKLAPGDYGSVRLRDKDFDTDVTITSADPGNRAVFDQYLELNDVSGVTIKGIDVEAGFYRIGFLFLEASSHQEPRRDIARHVGRRSYPDH